MPTIKNKRTTAIGILLIVGAICGSIAGVMSGNMTATEAFMAVGEALGGTGFLATTDKDGGL